MKKPYTQDQLDHYLLVGGKTRPEYGMIRQLMEENKRLTSSCAKILLEADKEGHDALVKAHRELEESHAELESLLEQVTS